MKNILITTTLLAAGASSALATAPLNFFGGGSQDNLNQYSQEYTYSAPQEHKYGALVNGKWSGSVGFDGQHPNSYVTNHRENMTIDLRKNARYEFSFKVTIDQPNNGYDIGTFNIYLAGNTGSLMYGISDINYCNDLASVYRYGQDVAEGNSGPGEQTYILNQSISGNAGVGYASPASGGTIIVNDQISSGTFTYQIMIEANATGEDYIFFYCGSTDRALGQSQMTMKVLGFDGNAVFDAFGFLTLNEGSSNISVKNAQAYAYNRTEKPDTIPPTEVDPSVPEPSAFGLLAGLGAIALSASRRRRK